MTAITAKKRTISVAIPADVRTLSSSDLLTELGRAISMTAESVAYLAACWCELERRGEDMSGLRIGLAPYLRDIASGRLASESVVAFAGQRMVMRWLSGLPVEDQRRLASGAPVEVVYGDGTTRTVPLAMIEARDLHYARRPGEDAPPEANLPRLRRGRPVTRSEPQRALTFLVSESEKRRLTDQARAEGKTISDFMRGQLGLALRVD